MKYCLLFLLLIATSIHAQEAESYVEKDFLILSSTKSLEGAVKFAREAAKKTGYEFKDTKLALEPNNGVTWPEETCKDAGFEWPCYVARGRWDDGGHISVELSDAYDGFTKGYFIVIAASGYHDNEEFKATVKHVKKVYPKSYTKRTRVYIGCIH